MEEGKHKGKPVILNKLKQHYEKTTIQRSPTTPISFTTQDDNRRHYSTQLIIKDDNPKLYLETVPRVLNISKEKVNGISELKLPSAEVGMKQQTKVTKDKKKKKWGFFNFCKCFFD